MNEALAALGIGLATLGDAAIQMLGRIADFVANNPDLAVAMVKMALAAVGVLL